MIDLTRRRLLTGTVASTAAAGLSLAPGRQARAAAPLAGTQAPSWYRYKVGSFEVTVVADGVNRFKFPDDIVSNVKREEVNAALVAAHGEPDVFVTPYNPIVVNTGQKLVVIDTGLGEAALNASKGRVGQFLTNLAATGIDPNAVDTVIISHYHGDHVNGLLKADNSLAFPNAEILVPAAEHKFWMDDGEMSRAPKGRIEELFRNNRRIFTGEVMKRLRTYDAGKEVAPGITAVATHGHTMGHNSHVLASGSSQVYVQADVTHVPFLFARNPGWHAFYDQDPVMAETTRRKVYDMLVAEKMLVQGFHYPFPSLAYVEKSGSGYREAPVAWNPTL
jgi:glyoxylase-like metal-dependent hydrolase (beta-lactamase superfamily II)